MSKPSLEQLALQAVNKYVRDNNVGASLHGHDPNGEPEGIVDSPGDLIGLSASTEILVKDIADKLVKRWPGFRWAVQPSEFGKIFNIFCLDFSGKWGYRIKFTDIQHDPKRREALKAGNELLRRFQYPGNRYSVEAMQALKRTASGEAIPDISDFKRGRQRDKVLLDQAIADGKAHHVTLPNGLQAIEIRR